MTTIGVYTHRARAGFINNRLVLRVTPTMAAAIQGAVLFQALSRGLDYLAMPDDAPTPNTLSYVESAIPLHVAGLLFGVAAIVGFVGMMFVHLPIASIAHAGIVIMYAIFGVGQLIEIGTRDDWYGWRTGTGFLIAAVIHGVCVRSSQTAWRLSRVVAG